MDDILADAETVFGRIFEYVGSLSQTELFVHASIGLIIFIILYILAYQFHVRVMLNSGVTWIWLLQGIYVILIAGGVSGIPYRWARFEAHLPNVNESTFLIFMLFPFVIGVFMFSAANHARSSTKIERGHKRGSKTPI